MKRPGIAWILGGFIAAVLLACVALSAVLFAVGAFRVLGRRTHHQSARAPGPGVTPGYLRIAVSPEASVYVEFRGDEMRMATTAEGLKAAETIHAVESSASETESDATRTRYTFGTVGLPVAADELPGKWSDPTAKLTVDEWAANQGTSRVGGATYAYGEFSLCREDARGGLWTYVFLLGDSIKPTPQQAPVVKLPRSDDAALQIAGVPRGDRLGIGLTLKAGGSEIYDVRRNGTSVNAQVTLRDARGKVLASVQKPLDEVGFA